jgi:hypothetical protein
MFASAVAAVQHGPGVSSTWFNLVLLVLILTMWLWCGVLQMKAEAEQHMLQQCSFAPKTGRGPAHRYAPVWQGSGATAEFLDSNLCLRLCCACASAVLAHLLCLRICCACASAVLAHLLMLVCAAAWLQVCAPGLSQ